MVMDFNTSSATTFIALKMVSKIGAAAQSAPVQITISTAADTGFDCADGTCRWGDYAAATPDSGRAHNRQHRPGVGHLDARRGWQHERQSLDDVELRRGALN